VAGEALRLHEEENGGGNHRDGDNPESDTDGVMSTNPLLLELMVDIAGCAVNVVDTDAGNAGGERRGGQHLWGGFHLVMN